MKLNYENVRERDLNLNPKWHILDTKFVHIQKNHPSDSNLRPVRVLKAVKQLTFATTW